MRKCLLIILSIQCVSFAALEEKQEVYEQKFIPSSDSRGESKAEYSKTEPEIVMSKWGGEAALSIKPVGNFSVVPSKSQEDKVQWSIKSGESLVAYSLTGEKGFPEGGVEIETHLDSIPSSNVFEFLISGHEDLDFFYQGPLDEEDLTGDTRVASCTPNECVNSQGEVMRSRGENVIGSYAVYHKTKANHISGKKNYQAGKLFHIYRPHAVDSIGVSVLCDLSFNSTSGVLSVTVPQKFLDTAVYPVVVDPTFGYTSVGVSTNSQGAFEDTNAVTATDSGDANPGTAFCSCWRSAGSGVVVVDVYDFGDGNISGNNRLAYSSDIAIDTTQAWRSAAITWTGITATTQYFIGIWSATLLVRSAYDTGVTDQYTNIGSGTAGPPADPHATRGGTAANQRISAYIDYTATSSGSQAGPQGKFAIQGAKVTVQ